MQVTATHAPGTFCWPELGTTDPKAALEFYTGLFGWTVNSVPFDDKGSLYHMLQVGGRDIGALYELMKDQREQGVPPHWGSYVSVASADEAAERAKGLGATLIAGPFDVMTQGRMAVLQDPTGAFFNLWEAKDHFGAQVLNEPGALAWTELMTGDVAPAADFYAKLFGWRPKRDQLGDIDYTTFMRGEEPAAGGLAIKPEWGEVPPHWAVYFAVTDCDATARRATELGGQIMVPPTDIPDIGRFATIKDPQGAVFSIILML